MGRWLIRTEEGKIFGPTSREKVIDAYNDKSLSHDDELCGDNGYWFYIHEDELLREYLFRYKPQREDVSQVAVKFPKNSDLAYPDQKPAVELEMSSDDITLVYEREPVEEGDKKPVNQDLLLEKPNEVVLSRPKKKPLVFKSSSPVKPVRNDRYMIFVIILLFIVLGFLLNKYTRVFNFLNVYIFTGHAYAVEYEPSLIQSRKLNFVIDSILINQLGKRVPQNIPDIYGLSTQGLRKLSSQEFLKIQKENNLSDRPVVEDILFWVNHFISQAHSKKLDEIKKITDSLQDHLLGKVAKMALSYKMGNKGRSYIILDSIFSKDKNFFNIANEVCAQIKHRDKFQKELLSMIKFLENNLEKLDFQFLIIYLRHYWPDFITSNFSISFSLKDFRSLGKTFRWGITYPALFLEELQARSTRADLEQYLKEVFKRVELRGLLKNHFWLFSFYTPTVKSTLDFIKTEIKKMRSSSDSYQRFLFLKALSNKNIYNLVKNDLNL